MVKKKFAPTQDVMAAIEKSLPPSQSPKFAPTQDVMAAIKRSIKRKRKAKKAKK